jgi:hypothetical protein
VNDFEDAEMIIGSIWGDEKLDLSINKDITEYLFDYLEIITEKMYSSMSVTGSSWNKKRSSDYNLNEHPKGVKICETPEQLMENLQKILRILGVHIGFAPTSL